MVRIYADIKMRKRRRKKAKPGQQSLPFHGGVRDGAGRPRNKNRVSHATRPVVKSRFPMHATMRLRRDVAQLRNFDLVPILKRAFVACLDKDGFRIVQFSIQTNHIHLICEADSNEALARGIQAWSVRVARGLNRKLGRHGSVFADRYHVELITMPKQMRNAYCYVLQNARHHGLDVGHVRHGIDPYSSGWWFDGWSRDDWRTGLSPPDLRTVAPARSWLATTGWRRHGTIGVTESPAEHMPRYRREDERPANWQ
jgi:REP-associated tyrosine transposase